MEKILGIEEQININADLLQIARDYCEFNIENSKVASILLSLIEILLQNQRNIVADIDEITLN